MRIRPATTATRATAAPEPGEMAATTAANSSGKDDTSHGNNDNAGDSKGKRAGKCKRRQGFGKNGNERRGETARSIEWDGDVGRV